MLRLHLQEATESTNEIKRTTATKRWEAKSQELITKVSYQLHLQHSVILQWSGDRSLGGTGSVIYNVYPNGKPGGLSISPVIFPLTMALKSDRGYTRLKPQVSQKPQPHIAFAPSIGVTQKGFNPPGDASHICNSNPGENVNLPQLSKSGKWLTRRSPRQLLSSTKHLLGLLAGFSSRATLSRRDRPPNTQSESMQQMYSRACYSLFHSVLPFTFPYCLLENSWTLCVVQRMIFHQPNPEFLSPVVPQP